MSDQFKTYARAIIDNAKTLAEVLHTGGLQLISGGTDNHLMLADVTPLGVTGKIAEAVLEQCGITVNKNMIPFDQRKPLGSLRDSHRDTRLDHAWHGGR